MCTRTRVCIYTCDKELSENSPRIDRNGANFNDNVRGDRDTLDRCEKRNKTQICANRKQVSRSSGVYVKTVRIMSVCM